MKKSILALAAISAVFAASATYAGRDELQTQIIRKAIEAKQAAQKKEQGRIAMRPPRPWWHPKLGFVPQS